MKYIYVPLHSNMFLLIQFQRDDPMCKKHPLHSNMFLLILLTLTYDDDHITRFTFQYVSINTKWQQIYDSSCLDFTFQYVSINTNAARYASQMGYAFTFQYVSINTYSVQSYYLLIVPLHSNMFLLILRLVCVGVTGKSSLYIPICFY